MNEPTRLLDDKDAPYAQDLAAVRGASFDYDQEKGAARFAAAIAAGGVVAGTASTASKWLGLKTWLLIGGAVTAASVGTYLVSKRRPAVESPAVVAQQVSASSAPPISSAPMAESPKVVEPPVVAPSALPVPSAPAASVTAAPTPRPLLAPPPAAPPSLAEETQSLAAIRRAAGSDPVGALSLIDQANKTFAGGVFAQEREAIAIGALAKLGRNAEATSRARKFLSMYPKSPLADQVKKNGGLL